MRRIVESGKARSVAALIVAVGFVVVPIGCGGKSGPQSYSVETNLDTADDASDPGPPAPQIGTQLDVPAPDLSARLAVQLAALPKRIEARGALLADPALRRQMRSGAKGEASAADQPGRAAERHWEIHFPKGNTIENYSKQLDFFGVELGLLMPDNKVIYAYNLSKLKPDTRTGSVDAESRYYLSWARGDLADADRELFTAAGVESKGHVILLFLPAPIESAFAALEKSYAGDKADKVQKTRFGIRRKGEGYEVYVMEQTYQQQPS
jgi:hypothetical protein